MIKKNLIAVVALAALGTLASVAQAHAKIEASEPKAGSALQGAPKEIRIHFNEALEPTFSKIQLVDAKAAEIALPKIAIDKADPKTMFAPVPSLQPGQYKVRWAAMTHDGHKVKGEFAFRVR